MWRRMTKSQTAELQYILTNFELVSPNAVPTNQLRNFLADNGYRHPNDHAAAPTPEVKGHTAILPEVESQIQAVVSQTRQSPRRIGIRVIQGYWYIQNMKQDGTVISTDWANPYTSRQEARVALAELVSGMVQ